MKKKNQVKIIGILLLSSMLVFSYCKKESGQSEKRSYFKMKVDGVLKEYDSCWTLAFTQPALNATFYQLNILCGGPGNYAGVFVNDIAPIKNGTYNSSIPNPATKAPMAGLGAYKAPESEHIYISWQAGWPVYQIEIIFTEFNSDYVIGTFRGKMRLVGGDKLVEVTEGAFKAIKN